MGKVQYLLLSRRHEVFPLWLEAPSMLTAVHCTQVAQNRPGQLKPSRE